jgi:AraC-like DNA-binding protein
LNSYTFTGASKKIRLFKSVERRLTHQASLTGTAGSRLSKNAPVQRQSKCVQRFAAVIPTETNIKQKSADFPSSAKKLNKSSISTAAAPAAIRPGQANRDHRVQVVKMLIEDNFQRHLDLTEMAKTVNLSSWRLAHLFKAEVGISPLRYLTLVRLQHARQHLETGFLTVREIAASVGIPNPSHFTRSFKAAYGSAPLQHRNTHFRLSVNTIEAEGHSGAAAIRKTWIDPTI